MHAHKQHISFIATNACLL